MHIIGIQEVNQFINFRHYGFTCKGHRRVKVHTRGMIPQVAILVAFSRLQVGYFGFQRVSKAFPAIEHPHFFAFSNRGTTPVGV